MKRTFAAALAAASVGSTMLVAAPAFAAIRPVTLTVKPRVIHNGEATAITGKCLNPLAHVRITSPALGINERGRVGKELKVQFDAGWGLEPGKYWIRAQCYTLFLPGLFTAKKLTVEHAVPVTPINPAKPVKPHPVIPGFTPDVTVETGFGGMARFVANHHPVG
jgi:hypothetical protein